MHQPMALAKGARITGGVFCLLFFLFLGYWLAVDLGEFGLDGVWESWTLQRPGGTNEVTGPFQLGLAVLDLVAVFAAFAGNRLAGGLLAVATTFTFATALQALVSVGNHTSDNRWFQHAETSTATFDGVFISSGLLFLLTLVAGIVLLAGMRSWPRPRPSEPPMRPAPTAGVLAGLLLGAMVLVNVVWQVYMLVQGGTGTFEMLYLGKGALSSLLSLAPGWSALVFLVLTALAALNSLLRGGAARGLAIGLSILSLPGALITVVALARNGALFSLNESLPGLSILNDVQLLLDTVGSVALLALMARGEPSAPAWYPPSQAAPFAVPGFVPPAGPPVPPVAGWQPPVGPVGGPPMPPPGTPPMPPPGTPPMPPGTPPAPGQGGFGPPQY
ncbi:hypothetical protein AB0C96_06015 [Streptomyces sp. NPDC048506]|uniref:hypothetical protein n=1 Tax=Streptomyces sp. NPDC048506 TaxID=3155028 RepID=UPI003423AB3C